MKIQNIILGIVIVVLIYFVYLYFFSDSTSKTLVKMHDARTLARISANTLPAGSSSNYTYSIWFYINDWNYRFGEPKVIFGRLDNNDDPSPSVTLAASTNNINVTLATYKTSGTDTSPTLHTCSIHDVPLQKWTNLIVTVNNRALDLYLDGKLVKTCVLPGVPKINPTSNVMITPDGGFSGHISNVIYLARAVNPSQAYDIYKKGFGGGSMLSGLLNKYRVKFAFLEHNREVNSFEL